MRGRGRGRGGPRFKGPPPLSHQRQRHYSGGDPLARHPLHSEHTASRPYDNPEPFGHQQAGPPSNMRNPPQMEHHIASNTATAALEASLLLLTEIANNYTPHNSFPSHPVQEPPYHHSHNSSPNTAYHESASHMRGTSGFGPRPGGDDSYAAGNGGSYSDKQFGLLYDSNERDREMRNGPRFGHGGDDMRNDPGPGGYSGDVKGNRYRAPPHAPPMHVSNGPPAEHERWNNDPGMPSFGNEHHVHHGEHVHNHGNHVHHDSRYSEEFWGRPASEGSNRLGGGVTVRHGDDNSSRYGDSDESRQGYGHGHGFRPRFHAEHGSGGDMHGRQDWQKPPHERDNSFEHTRHSDGPRPLFDNFRPHPDDSYGSNDGPSHHFHSKHHLDESKSGSDSDLFLPPKRTKLMEHHDQQPSHLHKSNRVPDLKVKQEKLDFAPPKQPVMNRLGPPSLSEGEYNDRHGPPADIHSRLGPVQRQDTPDLRTQLSERMARPTSPVAPPRPLFPPPATTSRPPEAARSRDKALPTLEVPDYLLPSGGSPSPMQTSNTGGAKTVVDKPTEQSKSRPRVGLKDPRKSSKVVAIKRPVPKSSKGKIAKSCGQQNGKASAKHSSTVPTQSPSSATVNSITNKVAPQSDSANNRPIMSLPSTKSSLVLNGPANATKPLPLLGKELAVPASESHSTAVSTCDVVSSAGSATVCEHSGKASSTKPPVSGYLATMGDVPVVPATVVSSHSSNIRSPLISVIKSSESERKQESDTEGSECGLVIDEDVNVHGLEFSNRLSPLTGKGSPIISRNINPMHLDSPDKERVCKKARSISLVELGPDLVQKLSDASEVDLLHRLYESMKILLRSINGQDSWHRDLVTRIHSLFGSYSIGSVKGPTKLKDIYKMELSHLHKSCGSNVSKWQEQIRRFNLLASTLPKNKEGARVDTKEENARKSTEKASADFVTSAKSTSSSEMVANEVAAVGDQLPLSSTSIGINDTRDFGNSALSTGIPPLATDLGEKGNDICNGDGMDDCDLRVKKLANGEAVGISDGEGSSGERSMSVCSTASNEDFVTQELERRVSNHKVDGFGAEANRNAGDTPSDDVGDDAKKIVQRRSLSPGELTPSPSPPSAVVESGVKGNVVAPSRPSGVQGNSAVADSSGAYQKPSTCASRPKRKFRPSPPRSTRRRSHHVLPNYSHGSKLQGRKHSRERFRSSRRSRSPNLRPRQWSSKSPIRSRSRTRRRSGSYPHQQPQKSKGKPEDDDDDDDLELLQLKKEAILSIMQKPEIVKEQEDDVHTESGLSVEPSSSELATSPKVSSDTHEESDGKNEVRTSEVNDSGGAEKLPPSPSPPPPPSPPPQLLPVMKSHSDTSHVRKPHSLNSSRAGSCLSSPVGSPALSFQADASSDDASKKDKSKAKAVVKSVSIKVCPGNESTWKIQPFHITSSGADSDSESGDVTSKEGVHGGISEVSLLLAEARMVATQASLRQDKLSASSVESLDLPSPPSALPINQQKEYMLLKRKLALHEKKMKSIREGSSVPSPPSHASPREVASSEPVKVLPQLATIDREPEARKARVEECQKKLLEYSRKINEHKELEENEQMKITSLTNQLTECVSEIEQHERNMHWVQEQLALLNQQLQDAEVSLKHHEQRMSELQEGVRSAKQRKAEFNSEIKDYEQVILEQEKLLTDLQSDLMEYRKLSPSCGKDQSHAYEDISDSECAPPSKSVLEVEPISDSEDIVQPSSFAMEVEPVSDAEPEATDTTTCVELRDHDYCSRGGQQHILPANVQHHSKNNCTLTNVDVVQSQKEVLVVEGIGLDTAEDAVDESSCICRRTLPFIRSTRKGKPMKKKLQPSSLSMSGGVENVLTTAMKNALPSHLPVLKQGGQQKSSKCTETVASSSSKTPSIVQPLLNTVVTLLTRQSVSSIASSTANVSGTTVDSNIHESGSDEWCSNVDAYFHSCTEQSFTLSQDDPLFIVVPRQAFAGDICLPIEENGISKTGLASVYKSITLTAKSYKSEPVSIKSEPVDNEALQPTVIATVISSPNMEQNVHLAIKPNSVAPLKVMSQQQVKSQVVVKVSGSKQGSVVTPQQLVKSHNGGKNQASQQPVKSNVSSSASEVKSGKVARVQSNNLSQQQVKSNSVSSVSRQQVKNSNLIRVKCQPNDRLQQRVKNSNVSSVKSNVSQQQVKGSNVSIMRSQSNNALQQQVKIQVEQPSSVSIKPQVSQALMQEGTKQSPICVKDDGTELSCARTLGYWKPVASSKLTSAPSSGAENSGSALSIIKKIVSASDVPKLLDRTFFIDSVNPKQVSAFTESSCNFFVPSTVVLAQNVLEKVEQLCSPSTSIGSALSPEGYQVYTSPLLMFSSYRLSPFFRTSGNTIPISSLTCSNKLDPHKVVCRFELTGLCSDPKCTAQHIRDAAMSKEEVIQDLVSYFPIVAGCTSQELGEGPSDTISKKISSHASKLLERYGDRISNEELYKLVIHETNTQRFRGKLKKDYITFDDRPWVSEASADTSKKPEQDKLSKLDAASEGDLIMECDPVLYSLPKPEERRRYFANEDCSTTVENAESAGPAEILSSVQTLVDHGSHDEAIQVLEEGFKQHGKSEDLWIYYFKVKAFRAATPDDLYQLFNKAVTESESYAVVLETIRLSRCYKSKMKAINKGLAMLREKTQKDAKVVSRQCLELLINAILLDLQTGRPSIALRRFDQIRLSGNSSGATSVDAPTSNFKGVFSILQKAEKVLFSLCHLSVLYAVQLPSCLFSADSYHVLPVRIASFQPFAIPFTNSINLPPHDYKKILRVFKVYFDLLQDSSLSNIKVVEQSLPLYKNLLLFEASHGSQQKTVNMLTKLTVLCPNLPDIWITLARMREIQGLDSSSVLEQAVSICPMNAELYYLGARLELARSKSKSGQSTAGGATRGTVQKAISWLVKCVREFFACNKSEILSTSQVLTLYRKLLNQMIGYNQHVPPLAPVVDTQLLKDHQAPLWMCYCLLVELSVPPSCGNGEFFHQNSEDAYESAIHLVRSPEGHKALWREYVHYMRSKAILSSQGFKALLDCVQRCLLDVEWVYNGQDVATSDKANENYVFHNEMSLPQMINVVTSCLPSSSPLKFTLLRKFLELLPQNSELLANVVQCGLLQENIEIVQTILAEYLAVRPHSPELWKWAIDIEIQLKHTREARWMFNKAVQSLPFHAKLWMDFLVFEVKEVAAKLSASDTEISTATVRGIIGVVKKAYQFGIDLLGVLRSLVSPSKPS